MFAISKCAKTIRFTVLELLLYFVTRNTISLNERKDIGRSAEVWEGKERSRARKRKQKETEKEQIKVQKKEKYIWSFIFLLI